MTTKAPTLPPTVLPCRKCRTNRPHVYAGPQQINGTRLALWTCVECGNSRYTHDEERAE